MKIRQKVNSGLHWTTVITEKTLLAVIGILTLFAAGTYVYNMYLSSTIELADLFMLFIYVEIIGMVGAFYQTQRIPVTLPIIIAITALCRLIVMQSKDMEATTVILEAGAILILSGAAYLMSLKDKLSLEKLQNKVDIGHKK
jgi:protein PsiE